MKLQLLIAAAASALSFAGMATAQEQATAPDWGDGAAYGGGRIIQGETFERSAAMPTLLMRSGASMQKSPTVSTSKEPVAVQSSTPRAAECFARVTFPAQYRTDKRQVVVQDAYKTLSVTEPNFEADTARIKTRDEYIRYKVRKPRWEVETEEITVRPEYQRLTVQPAQWRYIDETVDISQPRLVWKVGESSDEGITRTDPVTGTIFHLVEEAGEKRTFRKRVMASPEQVSARLVPAQNLIVTKRLLTDPGGVDEERVPAEYREIATQRLVVPSLPQEASVPATRDMIETQIMVSPERWDWTPVLCNENLSFGAIMEIQTMLRLAGVYDGAIDGAMGPQTKSALRAFQQSENLPHGGELTLTTLERLGAAHLIQAASM